MSSPRSRARGVGILCEPLQGVGAGQVLALNLAVEFGHGPFELIERAAQTLSVLLREFGRLRTDQSGQHGDGQSKSARQHRLTRLMDPGGS
jgi:hypothetical protein